MTRPARLILKVLLALGGASGCQSDMGHAEAEQTDVQQDDGCDHVEPSDDPECDRPPLCPQPAECDPGPGFMATGFDELFLLPNQQMVEFEFTRESMIEEITSARGQVGASDEGGTRLIFEGVEVQLRMAVGDAPVLPPPEGTTVEVQSCWYSFGEGSTADFILRVEGVPWVYFGTGYFNELGPCSLGLEVGGGAGASSAPECGWMPVPGDRRFAYLPHVLSIRAAGGEPVLIAPGRTAQVGDYQITTSSVFGPGSWTFCGDGAGHGWALAVNSSALTGQ